MHFIGGQGGSGFELPFIPRTSATKIRYHNRSLFCCSNANLISNKNLIDVCSLNDSETRNLYLSRSSKAG